MKYLSFALFALLTATKVLGQGDYYDNSGKIYSVVAIVFVLLTGIGFFLGYLDSRLKKLEKEILNDQRK